VARAGAALLLALNHHGAPGAIPQHRKRVLALHSALGCMIIHLGQNARTSELRAVTMRKKSKPKNRHSKSTSPRSAVSADIEMGRRIRLGRAEKGISQIELAGHLGLSFQQMQKYEKGINRVGAARLQQIAKMLGVDIPFFYDGVGKEPDVDSVLVLNSVFSLRLLSAYTTIKDKTVQRRLVILVEMIAASQR
jgi:transcriptional regulator with XRE-family HTH domain